MMIFCTSCPECTVLASVVCCTETLVVDTLITCISVPRLN